MNKIFDEYRSAIRQFPSYFLIESMHNILLQHSTWANNAYEQLIKKRGFFKREKVRRLEWTFSYRSVGNLLTRD